MDEIGLSLLDDPITRGALAVLALSILVTFDTALR